MGSGNRRTRVRKSEYVDILLDSVYDVNICRQGQIGSINFWTVRALFGARTKSRKSLLQLSPDSPIIARLYFPCYPFIGISTRATRDRDTRDTAEIRVRPNLDNARNPLPRLSALLRKPENKIVRPSSNQLADRQRRHRASYRSRAIVSLISGIINVIWKTLEDSSLFSISFSSSSFFFFLQSELRAYCVPRFVLRLYRSFVKLANISDGFDRCCVLVTPAVLFCYK